MFTPAEERVLDQVRLGLRDTEIATRMGVSRETVKYHVGNLMSKTYSASRAELVAWRPNEEGVRPAARHGWLAGLLDPLAPHAGWLSLLYSWPRL